MITDCRKFTNKITLYGISSFHCYRWNQIKVIPCLYTLYKNKIKVIGNATTERLHMTRSIVTITLVCFSKYTEILIEHCTFSLSQLYLVFPIRMSP